MSAGSTGQALAFGPGHVENTPDAGEPGIAVYSAHRDTHFRFLKDVAVGDEVTVTSVELACKEREKSCVTVSPAVTETSCVEESKPR